MLGLGIPCICIDLLGIASSNINTWEITPITYNQVSMDSILNTWNSEGNGKSAVSNTDPLSFVTSNNRITVNPIQLFDTPISKIPNNSEWLGLIEDNVIRNDKKDLDNKWKEGDLPNKDTNVSTFNEWNMPIPPFDEVEATFDNTYNTVASIIRLLASRQDPDNTWEANGSLSIASGNVPNNQYTTIILLTNITANTNNTYNGLFNNKEVVVDIPNNQWEVQTPFVIDVNTTNEINTLMSLIVPFRSSSVNNNEYETEASLANPIGIATNNTYSSSIVSKSIIRASLDNTYSTTFGSLQTILSAVFDNEYDTEIQLPFFIVTANAIFFNEWNATLESEVEPECPVPCGTARPSTPIKFVNLNLGTVEEIV